MTQRTSKPSSRDAFSLPAEGSAYGSMRWPTEPRTTVCGVEQVLQASSELDQGLRFSFKYVLALSDAVQVSRVLGEFPKPDPSLPTEGSVAYELRLRWRAKREGRERLSGACYAILTGLETNFGGNRDKAAARLSVVKPVLSTLGKLTAREDPVHGRAYGKAGGAAGPLTEAEVKWLEAVTPRLIRRAAEYEAKVPSLPQITMADLPPLSD